MMDEQTLDIITKINKTLETVIKNQGDIIKRLLKLEEGA